MTEIELKNIKSSEKPIKRRKKPRFLGVGTVLLVIFGACFGVFWALKSGIFIENLEIRGVAIQELSLRLDKKLVLNVKSVNLQKILRKNEKNFSLSDFAKKLRYFTWMIAYFQKFSVQKIVLDPENTAQILYDGAAYELKFPDFKAKFSLRNDNHDFIIFVDEFYATKYALALNGRVAYAPLRNDLDFDFAMTLREKQHIFAIGTTNLRTVSAKISGEIYENFDFLTPFLPDTNAFAGVNFAHASIKSLKFRAPLNENFGDEFFSTMAGEAHFTNVSYDLSAADPKPLAKSIPHFKSASLNLAIKNQRMIFSSPRVDFGANFLQDFSMSMKNFAENLNIFMALKSPQIALDTDVRALLARYDVKLPIQNFPHADPENAVKTELLARSDLKLSLTFLENDVFLRLNGGLFFENTAFLAFGEPFFAQNFSTHFDFTSQYKLIFLRAKNFMYENMLRADLDGQLDLANDEFNGVLDVHEAVFNTNSAQNFQKPYFSKASPPVILPKISYDFSVSPASLPKNVLENFIKEAIAADSADVGTEILRISGEKIGVFAKFSDPSNFFVEIPDLATKISINTTFDATLDPKNSQKNGFNPQNFARPQKYDIKFDDIGRFAPFSRPIQDLAIKSGELRVKTTDFDDFFFKTTLKNLQIPLYRKTGKKVRDLEFFGEILGSGEIFAENSDKSIVFSRKNSQNRVKIQDYFFQIDEFLNTQIPILARALQSAPKNVKNSVKKNRLDFVAQKYRYERAHGISPVLSEISGKNLVFFYKDFRIPADEINVIFRDEIVIGDLFYKSGIANIDLVENEVFVSANNFDDSFVNTIFRTKTVREGKFSLIGSLKNKVFHGEAKFFNTLVKDFILAQNIINLIDTVPSLIVFKNPNFFTAGYRVKTGEITFGVNEKYIGIERINMIGDSMDIHGNGVLELKNSALNINLELQTIKNLSNLLSQIPIVGYLILGDAGKISTNVAITGTLSTPKINISLSEDIIKAPFNIIRRVFSPIDVIVREIKNEIKDTEYRK